ncbi:GIY-YIG nuclease family protein [Mucilaginibacter sp. KACC 22063]|uniref:GIY-YIG nuclease family protein n=1 Tax=Mucilaginibacter sp. KACC 22063 TaxID=3025666 RepID=UPI0023662267|nr:GIY-YIG nuclease family protein [Mucilaginibacter sp. KACC 22063]WDF55614.1 GIY-YIG nuclease family protein [Mucilaginibacter sp. KACC 22063]
MFFSYILKSLKDEKYYYGSTNDVDKRLTKHNKGEVKATKHRRPLKLHYKEEHSTRSEAFKREMFYKSIEGYRFLKDNNIIRRDV